MKDFAEEEINPASEFSEWVLKNFRGEELKLASSTSSPDDFKAFVPGPNDDWLARTEVDVFKTLRVAFANDPEHFLIFIVKKHGNICATPGGLRITLAFEAARAVVISSLPRRPNALLP